MTDETVEQQAQDEAEGYAAGFAAVAGTEAPESKPEAAPEPEPAKEATEAPEAKKDETSAEDLALLERVAEGDMQGVTPEQFQTVLARMGELDAMRTHIDRANGRIGTLMQELEALRKAPAPPLAAPASAGTPVDEAAFVEAYGEDVAKYVEQKVEQRVASMTAANGAPSEEVVNRIIAAEQALAARQEAFQQEINLSLEHRDWQQVVNSKEYLAWLQLQPDNVRQVANTTQRADELGAIIGGFKEAATKAQTSARNKQRLEGAVVPTGVQSARPEEMTEDDAMRASFAAIRG